jgi:hypothetical protein
VVGVLAERDIAGLFRILSAWCGYSQRQVAILTSQSQSEISEIMAGRVVTYYDVLLRIAQGLGIPRGRLGLGYDPPTAPADRGATAADLVVAGGAARVASVPFTPVAVAPSRVTVDDVAQVVTTTSEIRRFDAQCGGWSAHERVRTHLLRTQPLVAASADDEVRAALHTAVGDLCLLAAWIAFDADLVSVCRARLRTAARYTASEVTVAAMTHYVRARLFLFHGWIDAALTEVRDGLAILDGGRVSDGHPRARAALLGPKALGLAHQGRVDAVGVLGQAADALAASDSTWTMQVLPWLDFVDDVHLAAVAGSVHGALAERLPDASRTGHHRDLAIARLREVISRRPAEQVRARVLDLCTLAGTYQDGGDPDAFVHVVEQALSLAAAVDSTRVSAALTRLHDRMPADCARSNDLADRIAHHLSRRSAS